MSISQQEPGGLPHEPNPADDRWEGHMCDGVGSTYGPKPTAFLYANSDEILLTGSRGAFRLLRSSISKIGRGKLYPWMFGGITIRHNVASFPKELQFQAMGVRSREILNRLRELGFPMA
jgi:hypothetical protein